MALTTTANVKTALRITEATDDTRIANLIAAVQALAETRCRRLFDQDAALQEIVEVLGVGGSSVRIKRPPINTLTAVYVSTDRPRVYDATTQIDSDDLLFDGDEGIVYRIDGRIFPADPHAVRIDYDGGFATIPSELERATIISVASMLAKDKGKLYHVVSQSGPGDGSIAGIRFDDLPDTAREIFDLYAIDTAV